MLLITAPEIDILDWLKRAEPSEVRESLEEPWEQTLEYSDAYAAIAQFAQQEPYYDEVTLENPERDLEVLEFLRSTSAELLFEMLTDHQSHPEGASAYWQISRFL